MALVLLTALVYARSLAVPIHDSDDYVYFFRDVRVEHLSWGNIWRILTEPFFANFHPLTTLTFAVDRAVWGTWVPGFHLTHLAFYAGGILGLYFLFSRLLDWRAGAFVAAAIFAAHTIHVESVAWLASRKDVVCLLFYAWALYAYVRYAGSPRFRWGAYAATFALAAAAMLSKGYAVILPATFFAYDLCFSGRVTRRQIVDKLPFLALAAAAILLTVHAQDRDSALVQSALTGEKRVALLSKILALYVGRTLLPIQLSAFYTVAGQPAGSMALVGLLLALAMVAGLFYLRRRNPAAAFAIALFVLPLGTVMNLFFTLRIWMADRYLLFPTIGSSLAVVALAAPLYGKLRGAGGKAGSRPLRNVIAVAAALVIGLYSYLTIARTSLWTSRVNLWSDVVRKALHLGGSGPVAASELGRVTSLPSAATSPIISLIRAYESEGKDAEAQSISGLMSRTGGRSTEESELALAQKDIDAGRLEEGLRRLRPISEGRSWIAPMATLWIGVAESRMGNEEASQGAFRLAVEKYRQTGQPATDAFFAVGTMELNKGNYAKAVEWYRQAHRESPHEAKSAFFLGRALANSGNPTEAMQLFKRIAAGGLPILAGSQFTMPDVYVQMGVAAQKLGNNQEAIGYWEEVLRRAPDHPEREAILAGVAALRGGSTR
jgi:tetratricopeptide (TPR) repeat protein